MQKQSQIKKDAATATDAFFDEKEANKCKCARCLYRREHGERRSMETLRDERGNKCSRCPSTVDLEFAHVKPTSLYGRGRGQMRRINDIRKNPDAYELMCKDCHSKFDRGGKKW